MSIIFFGKSVEELCLELERLGQEKLALTKLLSANKVHKEEWRINGQSQKEIEDIERQIRKEDRERFGGS